MPKGRQIILGKAAGNITSIKCISYNKSCAVSLLYGFFYYAETIVWNLSSPMFLMLNIKMRVTHCVLELTNLRFCKNVLQKCEFQNPICSHRLYIYLLWYQYIKQSLREVLLQKAYQEYNHFCVLKIIRQIVI